MLRHSVNFLDKNLKFYIWLSNMMIHDSPARLEKIQQKAFLGTPYCAFLLFRSKVFSESKIFLWDFSFNVNSFF